MEERLPLPEAAREPPAPATSRACSGVSAPRKPTAGSPAEARAGLAAIHPTLPGGVGSLGKYEGEMQPKTQYAKSGELNIAYQVVGEGPIDLVFTFGWVSISLPVGRSRR